MCGIAGIISEDSEQTKEVACRRMIESLLHRGPDGHSVAIKDSVGLAHARLAIVDLSVHANQPMRSHATGAIIVFNGEIYNYKDIRNELLSKGVSFKTSSDTEVLLSAYDHWGEQFIEKLNGIFAFAIHDVRRQCVLLARDRLGVKPLYWAREAGRIIFGSEIKALAASGFVQLRVDQNAFLEYLTFQNNFQERTLFNKVELFPAGSIARIDSSALTVSMRKFWQASFLPSKASAQDIKTSLHIALRSAVSNQTQADVPVNSFLSGGIDSCAIAAIASKNFDRIKTFTCGFMLEGVTANEQLFDERLSAESVAATIGSEHYETVLGEHDFLADMHEWAWHAEEPRVGSSFPNFCVSRLAAKFTKVCLSGTGGDELFAGYPWRYQPAVSSSNWDEFVGSYYGYWNRMVSANDLRALVGVTENKQYQPRAVFRELMDSARKRVEGSGNQFLDASLIFELETFLHGLLISEDKASMAHGLEVRVPLLDNSIIDLAFTIPAEMKVSMQANASEGTYGSAGVSVMPHYATGKKILREVLSPYVPEAISGGRKQGFSPPFETWFRRDLSGWIEGEVLGSSSPLRDYLDIGVAFRIWREHLSGEKNHRLFVWGLIALHLSIASFMRRANA